MEENFLTQLMCEPIGKGALLDRFDVDRAGPVGDGMAGGHPGAAIMEHTFFSALNIKLLIPLQLCTWSM